MLENAESVAVTTTPGGVPLSVLWRNRRWSLGATPTRWYERRPWWEKAPRAAKGTGAGLVDVEVWQAQIRLTSRSELLTVHLVHDQELGRWQIRKP